MNWMSEASTSWSWLHWAREVLDEDGRPASSLPELMRGLSQWDEAITRDRHAVGDPDRIRSNEHFVYAAAMMSRAAKTAINDALKVAIRWGVDDPLTWSMLPAEAKQHWADVQYRITTILTAWITLWRDLDGMQGTVEGAPDQVLDAWKSLADQAVQTIEGVAVAATAQRMVGR